MNRFWRQILMVSASTALAMAGMGSSCPGTGSTANFTNGLLLATRPTVAPLRNWHASMIIDPGASDLSNASIDRDQNVTIFGGVTGVSIYPTAVFHDADEQFYAIFTRGAGTPPAATSQVNAFATEQNNFGSDSWVTGLGSFTQLDVSTSNMTFQVKTNVDASGNATSFFNAVSTTAPNRVQLKSARHSFGNGSWDAPVTISSVTATTDVGLSTAAATDAFGNTVVVWVQPTAGQPQVFFNEFRPNLGWRFSSVNPLVPWNDVTINDPVKDRGVDVGFDSFGNGYGVYVADVTLPLPLVGSKTSIMTARWRSDKPENFPNTTIGFAGSDIGDIARVTDVAHTTAHSVFGYPRIYVGPNGRATVFWYENQGGPSAELWWSQTPANNLASTGSWGIAPTTPKRFDLDFGQPGTQVYMNEGSHLFVIPPILAYDGSVAAIATIKTDGTNRRLFVSKTVDGGASWSQLGTADLGGITRNVESANIAVNLLGDVAVVYSANDPSDFREHVYGNVYTEGSWTGVNQLDFNNSVLAFGRPNYALPNVTIDEQGNACAAYSVSDVLFSPQRRRVLANFYR